MNTFKLHITGIDLLHSYWSMTKCPIAHALNRHFNGNYRVSDNSARFLYSNENHLSWDIRDSNKVRERAGKWWNIFTRGITITVTNKYF